MQFLKKLRERINMPLLCEQDTAILSELGFTVSEAKVYLILTQIGTSGIGSITKATGIHREHMYQIVNTLEKKGLIEKEIGFPTLYRAVPLEAALHMLVNHKQAQITELKGKTETIIEKLKIRNKNNVVPTANKEMENHQFAMVPGKEIIVNRLRENIQKAQTSVEVVTTPIRFSSAIQEYVHDWKRALGRGVGIRICAERHVLEKKSSGIVRALAKNPRFEVKFFFGSADAVVVIYDRKQAFVITSVTANLAGASSLCSTNSSFVALAQHYFESMWNNSNSMA
jgi:sugar-specific transcriptional regulator TrmB